uniref:Deacetylase sirtuin-type domain-containing protein n=2 Tax=Mesocestoides corti TaxID=53468 RepID=A0A5K3G3M4_MESCO
MAIAELVSKGYVRYVVSQNVDGLHLRSGLPRDKLSELHGNLFIEQCMACDRVVYRSFDVGETTGKSRHLTGRVCPFCVPASSVDSPSNSLVQKLATGANSLATRRSKSSRASLDRVLAFKRAATSLRRIHAKRNRHNCSLPLMRDVIVHYFERQPVAGQAEIYRVDRAVAALYG